MSLISLCEYGNIPFCRSLYVVTICEAQCLIEFIYKSNTILCSTISHLLSPRNHGLNIPAVMDFMVVRT